MRRHTWRRMAMFLAALTIVLFFASAIIYSGPVTPGEVILGAAGFVFAYIVVRLTHTLVGADVRARRRAARWLMIASVVPALLLTPTVLERAPVETRVHIVVAGLVWAALAMAYTSFITHRATRRDVRRDRRPAGLSALVVQRVVQSSGKLDDENVDVVVVESDRDAETVRHAGDS